MQIISNIALISINETLIVQVISFLIFLFVINRIMFRPLRNVMADRDIYIERVKLDIAEARKKIESITSQIQKQETAVKKEAFELKDRLEKTGSAQANEIFAAVRKEIADTGKKVQMDIKARISEERQAMQKESEDLALIIINKILDRRQHL
jgi:F-type H+-transporting ATPase subunit b